MHPGLTTIGSKTVRQWKEVAFVAPSTRYAAAQGQALNAGGAAEARANLIPTLARDPVFGDAWLGPREGQTGISASLARKLNVMAGDVISLEITRGAGGERLFLSTLLSGL